MAANDVEQAGEMGSPIRICFLIDNLDVAGTERHVLQLIAALDRNTFLPLLVLLDGEHETSRQLEPEDCEVIRLGMSSFWTPSLILLAANVLSESFENAK